MKCGQQLGDRKKEEPVFLGSLRSRDVSLGDLDALVANYTISARRSENTNKITDLWTITTSPSFTFVFLHIYHSTNT